MIHIHIHTHTHTHDTYIYKYTHTKKEPMREVSLFFLKVFLEPFFLISQNPFDYFFAELYEPVVFMPVAASTSGRINEEILRVLFLHANREASALDGELTRGVGSVPIPSSCLFGKSQGFYCFDVSKSLGHEGYYSPRLIYSVIHTFTTFYSHS